MSAIPTLSLNDGRSIPQLGFGVFQVPEDETEAAVSAALEAGYRSLDTAAIYGNEAGVGRAIAASGIPRDELFVTTKLWNDAHRHDDALAALDRSLEQLGLDAVDLYLIHWPVPSADRYLEAWRALEELRTSRRTHSIGVSNFQIPHLRRLLDEADVVPAINQIELHPLLPQSELRAFHAEHGIRTEAWSPLAQGAVLGDATITRIAAAHDRTAAQVVLRWHLQLGNVVIPKSVTPKRIAENLDVFDFTLSDDDLQAIAGLADGTRTGPDPDVFAGGA